MFTTASIIAAAATTTASDGRWDGDGPPAFWPIFPILWFCIFAAVVVTAIVLSRRRCAGAPRRTGEARLAERYAAGEIDEEEFRTRRAVLRETG